MIFKDKLHSFLAVIKVRFLNKRIPIAVRLQLTNRCTLRCKYCNLWKTKTAELSTNQIIKIIDELALIGTKRISLSGGEPLLRKDIGTIIDYCRKKFIYPEMNSNGTLVADKINIIKNLDFLKLSLDGPEKIHNLIRGEYSYQKVIEAAEIAYKNNINFAFACTLTKYNINFIDHVLTIARKYKTIVALQPIKEIYRGIEDTKELSPVQNEFKQAINNLIKNRNNKNLRNSLDNLKHIYNWPKYKRLKCWAGQIFCIIDTNGDIYPCDRINYAIQPPNCVSLGVKEALKILPKIHCSGCGFCGALELNYLMRFKINTLASIKKIVNR